MWTCMPCLWWCWQDGCLACSCIVNVLGGLPSPMLFVWLSMQFIFFWVVVVHLLVLNVWVDSFIHVWWMIFTSKFLPGLQDVFSHGMLLSMLVGVFFSNGCCVSVFVTGWYQLLTLCCFGDTLWLGLCTALHVHTIHCACCWAAGSFTNSTFVVFWVAFGLFCHSYWLADLPPVFVESSFPCIHS